MNGQFSTHTIESYTQCVSVRFVELRVKLPFGLEGRE